MFFISILIGMTLGGSILCVIDFVFPGLFLPVVALGMRLMGIMLIWCGVGVYCARSMQTGACYIEDLPKPQNVLLLHIGNSGVRIVKTEKDVCNTLINRRMRLRFKDMGNSVPLAGHLFQISMETFGQTIPVEILNFIQRVKQKYKISDKKELYDLYDKLKNLKEKEDLYDIPLMVAAMKDENIKKELMDAELDDIRHLRLLLFDGHTLDMLAYKDFDETSSPYDNESIISRTIAHRAEQRTGYMYAGGVEWGKIVIPAMVVLVLGAVAYQIFGGG